MKAPNRVSLKELAEEMEKRLTTSGRHIHRCRECDDERVELLQLLRERNNLLSCKYYNDKLHTELKSRTHIHPWRRTLFFSR